MPSTSLCNCNNCNDQTFPMLSDQPWRSHQKHLKMPLTHSIWLWWAIGVTTFLSEKKFTKAIHILKPIWQNLHAIMGSKQEIWAKKEESLQNILGNAFNSLNLAVMSHWRHNLLEWVRVKSIASIFTEESNPRTKYPVPKCQKDYFKIQKVNKCNK